MQTVAAAIGVFLVLVSLYQLALPAHAVQLAGDIVGSKLRYLAALLRLLMGVVFLAAAALSRYPTLYELLGWLFVLGGLLLVVLPPGALEWIVGLIEKAPAWLVRLMSPLVFLFGAFIFYSFT